jgi:hypothetical protein
MKTIYKYKLETIESQNIRMPRDSKALSVQIQKKELFGHLTESGVHSSVREDIYLWAEVEPEAELVAYPVRICCTGEPLDGHPGRFVGTVQLNKGFVVLHVFIGEGA